MIVVTGMHRSGTSAVSMILEALGVDFGNHDAFYAADQWNEHGYFERCDVIDLNSRLLTGFPRTQGQPEAILSQVRYLLDPSPAAVERRAGRLASEVRHLAATLNDLAVKDPRFCLTMPVWRESVTHTVVCLRHPGSVARSLKRRQRIPAHIAFHSWNRHAEGLLAHLGQSTTYVDFDALGSKGASQELESLTSRLGLEVASPEASSRLQTRFASGLRHFNGDSDDDLPVRTRRLWTQLQDRRRSQQAM